MYKRALFSKLFAWYHKKNRKPLIIRGARQVGKTCAVKYFAELHNLPLIYLNLEKKGEAEFFELSDSPSEIIRAIENYKQIRIQRGVTILFIDEIQASPRAISLLRYFYEEMPDLPVISAGSLLDVVLERSKTIMPVGRVEFVDLQPFSFDEFLEAKGKLNLLSELRQIQIETDVGPLLHRQLSREFLDYALIGGMPEALKVYFNSGSLLDVREVHGNILMAYNSDIGKYASPNKAVYLQHVLHNIPLYIGKQITYKHFAFSRYQSREISEAFDTLELCYLVRRAFSSRSTFLPLIANKRKMPKLIFLDVGLANHRLGQFCPFSSLSELENNYQGQLSEQIAGQTLITSQTNSLEDLLYWYRDAPGSTAEVDFLINHNNQPIPIEIKANSQSHLKSLHLFMSESKSTCAIKVSMDELSLAEVSRGKGSKFTLISLPFYLLHRIKDLL